jgi:hypothetical protein
MMQMHYFFFFSIHRNHPYLALTLTTKEQKRIGWEMAVRIEKIIAIVLREAHERQVEEAMDTLSDGPESLYKSYLD